MDETTQAILLLSARFSRKKAGQATPLTPTEYGRFAAWLRDQGRQPADLLRNFDEIVAEWSDPKGKVNRDRLQALLGRGMAMGIALEKWNSAGIWILTRAQPKYPDRLIQRLGRTSPAVLLGVGDASLLETGGVAIVGSRNIDASEEKFTRSIARAAAYEGMTVVSGGARGVDEIAMQAAIDGGGIAVGVLASDLLKAALSSKWRKALKSGQLCLVTPYSPEAPFQVGNAMGRNKYVYCLADFGVVVRSDQERGGTWAGANEVLSHRWVPLFVRAPSTVDGNHALAKMGALELALPETADPSSEGWLRPKLEAARTTEPNEVAPVTEESLYERVLAHANEVLEAKTRLTLVELKKAFSDASQTELIECLDRATDEGILERRGQKRVYAKRVPADVQQELFDDAH